MDTQSDTHKQPDRLTRILRWVVGFIVGALVVVAALISLVYILSPAAIRHPQGTHYHFRLQVIQNRQAVNFGDSAFQTPLNHDICNAKLTKEPIHFHDGVDQFVHIHWQHIKGGLLLKNYGWNVVGGIPGSLGYRFDQLPKLTNVAIHGKALPPVKDDLQYYVFIGDEQGYIERSWNDFLRQDLNVFFGQPQDPTVLKPAGLDVSLEAATNWLVSTAQAHEHEADSNHSDTPATHSNNQAHDQSADPQSTEPADLRTNQAQEQLAKLHHMVGNAVIFVQKDKPTDNEIKDRFKRLVPLPESSCGG